MPPEIIAGRYRLEREVGRGGMGSVWLCRDERLGRDVAVKQVGGLPGESSMHVARALREARHSAALDHPNVVSIFDAVEEGDHVWLVMEYVPGHTLAELIRSEGQLSPKRVAAIGAQVAEGLAAAHARGTIHRDVKPSNILVRDTDGVAKIADFGIARTLGQEQLTRTGLVSGTPAYFSPELARGEDPTPASDMWALGASLYAAVEGDPPYPERANAIAMLTTIAAELPKRPRRAGDLERPIARMMDPDPQSRWTMARAADELRRVHESHRRESTTVLPTADPVHGPAPDVAPDLEPARPPTPAASAGTPAPPPPVEPVLGHDGGDEGSWDDDRGGRRGAWLAVALVAVLAAVAGGFWLLGPDDDATTSSDPGQSSATQKAKKSPEQDPTTTAASPTAASSPTVSASPTASATPPATTGGSRMDFVESYYSSLPGDVDSGWSQLSPQLQDQIGYDSYRGFWSTIDAVRVDSTRPSGPDGVSVTLTYTTDRGTESETRLLQVERSGDGYLISGDQVQ